MSLELSFMGIHHGEAALQFDARYYLISPTLFRARR